MSCNDFIDYLCYCVLLGNEPGMVVKRAYLYGYIIVLFNQNHLCNVLWMVYDTDCAGDDVDGEINCDKKRNPVKPYVCLTGFFLFII